ncbi:MAG: hydrogenase expression/formation protein [Candidatus Latescibacteria bacterium]|nr:hydrogenase expression/formation protein [Candidatus Latescibacterota bacterium]
MDEAYPIGKLPAEDLERILDRLPKSNDTRIVVGPGIGEDAAVISFDKTVLVAKSDPITFATDRIGWYAVHVNANDIATMGATPKWFLATLLLPENATTPELIEHIFQGITEACRDLNVTLCGGHTEITHGLTRPIVVGQMLGEADKKDIVSASGTCIGDDILLTKGIAIEATALIAIEKSDELAEHFSPTFLARCRNYLQDPGISVVRDAQIAQATGGIHAMHDPTEGGLASGLREMATASGCGLILEADTVCLLPEPEALCRHYQLDPLGSIASGALLLTVDPVFTPRIIDALKQAGIPSARIGSIQSQEAGCKMIRQGAVCDLPTFQRDEIGKVFEG